MSDVHAIRLRGPWQMEPLVCFAPAEASGAGQGGGELPPPGRVKLPTTCEAALPGGFCGRVRFARRFQRPTGLAYKTVHLVVDTPWTIVRLTLNEHALEIERALEIATDDRLSVRLNLTDRLADTNVLAIEVEYPADRTTAGQDTAGQASSATPKGSATLLGEVRLEIG